MVGSNERERAGAAESQAQRAACNDVSARSYFHASRVSIRVLCHAQRFSLSSPGAPRLMHDARWPPPSTLGLHHSLREDLLSGTEWTFPLRLV